MISSHLCFGQVSPLRFQGGRARGFFTHSFTPGLIPYVQPFLYRLKFAAQVQFQLIHVVSFVHADMLFFFAKPRTPIVP